MRLWAAPGGPHLPGSQTGSAHQVSARLDLHVLVVLRTDLTELEGGAHLTVQLVLFLQGQQRRRHKLLATLQFTS